MISKRIAELIAIVAIVGAAFAAGWYLRPVAGLQSEGAEADASRRFDRQPNPYLPLPERPDDWQEEEAPRSQFGLLAPREAALPGETVYSYGEFVPIKEYRWNCQPGIYYIRPQFFDSMETCQRRFEIDHPYALFTDAQLAQIAPTDGEAAYILALRQLIDLPEGEKQDVEAGVNNVMSAIIRGGGRQAFSLLVDPDVFSLFRNPGSYLLWSRVGFDLGLLDDVHTDRLRRAEAEFDSDWMQSIENEAEEIANLLREQRLIVMGTEFQEDNTTP